MNENTRFLIYIYRERYHSERKYKIRTVRDLYSERKNKIINIYIERDFYNERKYNVLYIYIYI